MSAKDPVLSQEKTILGVRLDNLSVAVKKLASVFIYIESEMSISIVEPQIINRLLAMTNEIKTLKSLEENEGEVFAVFLKNMFDIVQSIGILSKGGVQLKDEQLIKIMKSMKNLEERIKDVLPVVIAIDEVRKRLSFETFGGLLQRVVDAIQEKRHLIMRSRV